MIKAAAGIEAHKVVQEAEQYYTAILQVQSKHPDANQYGCLAVGVGRFRITLFFKTALETSPTAAQYWLSYIDALIRLDRMDEAKTVLDQAKSKGANGDGFDKLEHQLNSDANNLEKVSGSNKQLSNKLQTLINLYNRGHFSQVIQQADKSLKQYPGNPIILNLMGSSAAQTGKLEQAVSAFEKVIKLRPDNADAYNNMGNAQGPRQAGRSNRGLQRSCSHQAGLCRLTTIWVTL